MQESFDPYRKWLGISATERPPNHYRLLGLELFEDDPEAIAHAADQRISYVRTLAIGEHADLSQQILNELATARVCLLNSARKADYDARLRRSVVPLATLSSLPRSPPPTVSASSHAPVNAPTAVAMPGPLPQMQAVAAEPGPSAWSARRYLRFRRTGSRKWLWLLGATAATASLVLAIAWSGQKRGWIESMVDGMSQHRQADAIASSRAEQMNQQPTSPSNEAFDVATPIDPVQNAIAGQRPGRPSEEAVDLLTLIDPVQDAIAGQWRWHRGCLVSKNIAFSRLDIPYGVPDEYRLTLIVEPNRPGHELYVGLPVRMGQVLLAIDAFGDDTTMLYSMDGTLAFDHGSTKGRKLRDGRQNEIACVVRRSSLVVACNGETCVEWNPGTDVRAIPTVWQTKYLNHLMIGGANEHRIVALWLEALSKGGETTRDLPPEMPSSNRGTENSSSGGGMAKPLRQPPPIALAPFSAKEARQHQENWAKYLKRDVEETNSIGMKLVLIPPGKFDVGTPQEELDRLLANSSKPDSPSWIAANLRREQLKHAAIANAYLLSAQEVTVGDFRRFVQATGYKTIAESDGGGGGWRANGEWVGRAPEFSWQNVGSHRTNDLLPVVNVALGDAEAFCDWLSKLESRVYRLPNTDEWEFACRAGTTTSQYFSPREPVEFCWWGVNSNHQLHQVRQKRPNAFSLFDMLGNASELCRDQRGSEVVLQSRGGHFWCDYFALRAAYREDPGPTDRGVREGFRVVCELNDSKASSDKSAAIASTAATSGTESTVSGAVPAGSTSESIPLRRVVISGVSSPKSEPTLAEGAGKLGMNVHFASGRAFVNKIVRASAAERAGIRFGDIIVSINGKAINSTERWRTTTSEIKVGDKLHVSVMRTGEQMNLQFTVH